MKKLDEKFKQITQNVSEILATTMQIYEIPNVIICKIKNKTDEFELKFTRTKILNEDVRKDSVKKCEYPYEAYKCPLFKHNGSCSQCNDNG